MSTGLPRWPFAAANDRTVAAREAAAILRSDGLPRVDRRQVEAILHAAPAAIFIAHDPDCRRITRTRAAWELLHAPQRHDPSTRAPPERQSLEKQTCPGSEEWTSPESLVQRAAHGTEVGGIELGVVLDDGAAKHLYGSAAPLLDEQGLPQGAIAVFVDVTALKQANERLAAQVRELARSNSELEHFASIVSHDLRSPLMTLSGCTHLLLKQDANGLSPEGRELIHYIQDSTRHMSRLVKRLLESARAEHGELELIDCDANSALRTALSLLQADLDRAAGSVTADPLPTVRADEALLTQVLQNLIENAIKYRGDAPPRIHVSARKEASSWVFSVKDNGIGIDPQHFERIFRAFKRLPAEKSRCPGLGLGLAICKQTVERHGGRIWVESRPGLGATFFFSLAQ